MTKANEGTFKKKLLAVAVLAPAMALTACNSDDYTSADPSTISSGVVFDGYLQNAIVCVDVNQNKKCDAGEPQTTTGAGGVYELTGLTAAQQRYPLVMVATAGTTIDEDTGAPVEDDFNYQAPAGGSAISALTTIVQIEREKLIAAGATPSEATAQANATVATALGVSGTDILNFDAPAVAAENSADSDVAARLHIVNQILTKKIVAAVASAPAGADADNNFSAIYFAAVSNVADLLTETKAAVDEAIPDGMTAQDLDATTLEEVLTTVDAEITPENVKANDIADAQEIVEAAQDAIASEIEEETGETVEPEAPTGSTGGSGAGGGEQGVN
ncbi:hypothetical protein FWJ25_04555 [Marinobacter salinexigens]|uniref:Uncharacterized protein n=1 Tax=Marinobacter salinexigens TaxID=2919747 RepID=A0A5B0VJ59_9GAMM|nr:hypothetical protein [Marinobacter salinexigens]KAA1174666.1 hypothetical protein FWJ25_04555 [Marinobacter salinexigens]